MGVPAKAGFYGKLPGHGDFIYRDLPNHFIEVWDNWLQLFISASQEQIGEGWLDIYLTSPIWRFAFSEGVVDEQAWQGVVLPSVDRVGRYFPFSIVTPLPPGSNPVVEISQQHAWLDNAEQVALQALNQELDLEEILVAINQEPLVVDDLYIRNAGAQHHSPLLARLEFEEQSPQVALPQLLDASLRNSFTSYSAWTTRGSEYVEPCLFVSQALPPMTGIAAMMDGQWQHWNWPEPYALNPQNQEYQQDDE